jgi:hypothetical protein
MAIFVNMPTPLAIDDRFNSQYRGMVFLAGDGPGSGK